MPLLAPEDVDMLRQACRDGVVKVKVAGRISQDAQAAEFERCKSATVLQHLGFLEPMPDDGAYARWRPAAGCRDAVDHLIGSGRWRP